MSRIKFHNWIICCGIVATFALGCAPKPDQAHNHGHEHAHTEAHDPDDVHIRPEDVKRPANYAEAVARIKSYRDKIRDEIAADRPSKAHRPLDEATHVLDWLPEIAQQSDVPKENWEAVNTSAQMIRQKFDEVHLRIDRKQAPDYDSVSEEIEKSIATLESIQSGSSKPAEDAENGESSNSEENK